MSTKLIMLAHGSSNTSWSESFFEMTNCVTTAHRGAALAFMELSTPSLHDVCRTAALQGAGEIKVLPLFLATGRHLKKDVPAMLDDLRAELGIEIQLLPPIGENELLRQAIRSIVEDELAQ